MLSQVAISCCNRSRNPYYNWLLCLAKILYYLFSDVSIFSAISFLFNHQVGLRHDSRNSASKDVRLSATFIYFLINIMNKSFLYFKGTRFFWVYCWNDKWSKAAANSIPTQWDCVSSTIQSWCEGLVLRKKKSASFWCSILAFSLQTALLWRSKQTLLLCEDQSGTVHGDSIIWLWKSAVPQEVVPVTDRARGFSTPSFS